MRVEGLAQRRTRSSPCSSRPRARRATSRSTSPRAGLSATGAGRRFFPLPHPSARRAAIPFRLANDQRGMQPVSSLPAARASHHAGAGDRRLRGLPARDRARAEVRRTALAGKAARVALAQHGADVLRMRMSWCRFRCTDRGSGRAVSIRPRKSRVPSCPDRPRPQARACDPVADRSAGREAARERAKCVRARAACPDS